MIQAESVAIHYGVNDQVRSIRMELNNFDKENQMWFQHSRSLWAAYGDKHSKYFHSQATQRYRKNHIALIRTSSRVWSMNMEEVSTSFINYFNDLFSQASPTHCEETLGSIHIFISPEMNRKLCADFMAREIHDNIRQMAPLKESGPDGMPIGNW